MKIDIESIKKVKLNKDDILLVEYNPEKITNAEKNGMHDCLESLTGEGQYMLYPVGLIKNVKCVTI